MGWSRQKAIASWQRCRSCKTCCLCVALPLQPEGCSREDGGSAGSPEPRRAQRPAPRSAAAGGFPPARGEETASAPDGGKASPGSPILRWLLGFGSASPRGRDGDAAGSPPPQPSVFSGAPRRAAAAPRRRLRHRPEHPRCPSAAAAAGDSPGSETPAPPAGTG